MTYVLCEPVFATSWTRIHIRNLEGKEPKVGGGINTPTLCGRLMYYGWDLEEPITIASLDAGLNSDVNPACPKCAEIWKHRVHGIEPPPPPPPPKVQGMRATQVILDEASQLPDPF